MGKLHPPPIIFTQEIVMQGKQEFFLPPHHSTEPSLIPGDFKNAFTHSCCVAADPYLPTLLAPNKVDGQ